MSAKDNNWFKMPFREGFLIILIVLFLIVFMLPWSYDVTILNISLVAWAGLALQLVIPILALILTWEKKNVRKSVNKGGNSNIPEDL
ncbi:hypothetical protein EPH95_04260 [Salicibibacter halophilus]|uniref:Uncharacterized protein n=1 Tax=Salicibibacter halophilus TaxID=2502791 RepID=A0A514LF60_9BACI|nr:hypothetical protein [Salicibibacter halophilus]QDI90490.1 hypothetical protein EPH95_04260 [Salicibibacter halophilus]